MQTIHPSTLQKWLPWAFLLINFVLKFFFIAENSLANDEPFSVYHAHMSPTQIVHYLKLGNNPPLYELLLHYWIQIFGDSLFSVRFPSYLLSAATVYFVFRLGSYFFSLRVATMASVLYSFSNYQMIYAHEARVYAMFGFLTVFSMFLYLRLFAHDKKFKAYIALLVVNTILLYSHYFGFFVIAIQTIFILFSGRDDKNRPGMRYGIYLILLFLAYLPNLWLVFTRFYVSSTEGTWLSKPNGLHALYQLLWKFSNQPLPTVVCIVIIIAGSARLIGKKEFSAKNLANRFVFFWFFLPLVLVFSVSFYVPMFLDRYMIFISVAYYLLVAVCTDELAKVHRWRVLLFLLPCILFMGTYRLYVHNEKPMYEIVGTIDNLKTDATEVFISPTEPSYAFLYVYRRDLFREIDADDPHKHTFDLLRNQHIYPVYPSSKVWPTSDHVLYWNANGKMQKGEDKILTQLSSSYPYEKIYDCSDGFSVHSYSKKPLQ